MKKLFTVFGIVLLLMILSLTAMAEEANLADVVNVIIEDNLQSELSPKEKAIALLLESGWKINEIYDCMSEEEILEYANALSIEGKRTYIAAYHNEENDIKIELSRQQFDYYSNVSEKAECDLSDMSSNGMIELQQMQNNEKDVGGMSAHQILMNTNTCYLRQDLYATWMGNNRYLTSYRCEWMKMPNNQYKDAFGISFDEQLMFRDEKLTSYVYKCGSPLNNSTDDVLVEKSSPEKVNFFKQGVYCQEFIYPYDELTNYEIGGGISHPPIDHARAYMKTNVYINDTAPTQQYFRFWSFYYHAKREITCNLSISLLPNVSAGISISPTGYHVQEDQHRYIYVKNPHF